MAVFVQPAALRGQPEIPGACPLVRSLNMDQSEITARATIAAALIVSRAVEIPTIVMGSDWSKDPAALRLRDLTDYVYRMISAPSTG
jgi:hypothetical protein